MSDLVTLAERLACGRGCPELVIRVGLEGLPRVFLAAENAEDEERLFAWLRTAPTRSRIDLALDLLDELLDEAA